jgi:hypothetical protein
MRACTAQQHRAIQRQVAGQVEMVVSAVENIRTKPAFETSIAHCAAIGTPVAS